jgi:hypothetical protein
MRRTGGLPHLSAMDSFRKELPNERFEAETTFVIIKQL